MEQYENDSDYINSLGGKERYEFLLSQVDDEKLKSWVIEQENLKNNLSNEDDPMLKDIMYIGGMDISYDKDDKKVGISGLVILDYKTLEIVYEDYNIIKIEEPYVPGFLAFREVKHLVKLIDNLKLNAPQFLPQVFLLNGNGILHPKELGIACHLGVLTDTTTIGCSKSFFSIDGINKETIKEMIEEYLHKKGDSKELIGFSGRHWGYILKSSDKDEYPLIISMGNKITNQTALKIVKKMCKQRIPEPIRLADLITRRLIKARKKFGKNNNIWNWNLKDYLINEHDYLHSNLQQSFEEGKRRYICLCQTNEQRMLKEAENLQIKKPKYKEIPKDEALLLDKRIIEQEKKEYFVSEKFIEYIPSKEFTEFFELLYGSNKKKDINKRYGL